MKDLLRIVKTMLRSNPRVSEYNLKFFKKAVKTQKGVELTDEEAKQVGRLMVKLLQQKCDLRYLVAKKK